MIIATGLALALPWALHPYSTIVSFEQWSFSLFFIVPYLIVAYSAARLRNRPFLLAFLLFVTVLFGMAATSLRFGEMLLGLSIAQGRSEGRQPMACGPPPALFIATIEYSLFFPLTLIFGLVAMILGPKPESQAPLNIRELGAQSLPEPPPEDVRIQADTRQIRAQRWDRLDKGDQGECMAD
jgi:hypothetical protein